MGFCLPWIYMAIAFDYHKGEMELLCSDEKAYNQREKQTFGWKMSYPPSSETVAGPRNLTFHELCLAV